jgi:aspartokinase
MRTISTAVEEIISQSPMLAEALAEDIANHSKIARLIKPQVEKRLYEEVSEPAIAMALRRLAKSLPKKSFGATFLHKLNDMTVRSNLTEFIFRASPQLPALHLKILDMFRNKTDLYLHLSYGLHESIAVVSSELAEETHAVLKNEQGLQKIENLSSITLRLPVESLTVPGVYYPVLKALAWEGINFIEILSSSTELTILFDSKDIDRAFAVLKRITTPES